MKDRDGKNYFRTWPIEGQPGMTRNFALAKWVTRAIVNISRKRWPTSPFSLVGAMFGGGEELGLGGLLRPG